MPDDVTLQKKPRRCTGQEKDYDVGYGKPPKTTQFKPGRSGNPRGRPKGAKNKKLDIPRKNEERMKQVILEECYRHIGIRDGEKFIRIPVIQAVVRNLALNAIKGNQRSQRMLTDSLKWVEQTEKAEYEEYLKTMMEYKVHWEKVLAARKEQGIEGERPYPHPDDIHFNFATGEVIVQGPLSKDEEDYVETFELKVKIQAAIDDAELELTEKHCVQSSKKKLERLRPVLRKIEATLEKHPGRGRFANIDWPPMPEGDIDL